MDSGTGASRASCSTTGSTRLSSSARCQRLRARARGFTADVEDVGAVRNHPQAVRDGARRIEAHAAVGERIRRDVEDAHDQRTFAELEGRACRGGGRCRGFAASCAIGELVER